MNKKKCFTVEEKNYLKRILLEYRNIIDNKKNDISSNINKKRAWEKITEEFNRIGSHGKRTTSQLRKCWNNMKARRKKQLMYARALRLQSKGVELGAVMGNNIHEDESNVELNTVETVLEENVMDAGNCSPEEETFDDIQLRNANQMLSDADPMTNHQRKYMEILEKGHVSKKELLMLTVIAAVEKELDMRLNKAVKSERYNEELHELRRKELLLKIKEQEINLLVAQEKLKQEKIKTDILKRNTE